MSVSAVRRRLSLGVALLGFLVVGALFNASRADALADHDAAPMQITTLPTGKGLPVVVRTAVQFVDVQGVDENSGTFDATVDLRLTWQDLRQVGRELDVRGDDAEQALSEMWFPDIAIGNLADDPAYETRGLRVDTKGNVELMQRTQGTFVTPFDATTFPFDRDRLEVEVIVRGAVSDDVTLDFRNSDVAFSKAASGLHIDGWEPSIVDLRRKPLAGWHDKAHARVLAGLWVQRDWSTTLPSVFIPLFASLLIPLVSIWLQDSEEPGDFKVDAFELTNLIIGGLFAVIALNFTVAGGYVTLATGDNTVNRLFALNYGALALAFLNNILVFQLGVPKKLFGAHVQEELFRWSFWAFPVLVFGTAAALLAVAAS